MQYQQPDSSPITKILGAELSSVFRDCLPSLSSYIPLTAEDSMEKDDLPTKVLGLRHGVAMSGTGESFRIAAQMSSTCLSYTSYVRQWIDLTKAVL